MLISLGTLHDESGFLLAGQCLDLQREIIGLLLCLKILQAVIVKDFADQSFVQFRCANSKNNPANRIWVVSSEQLGGIWFVFWQLPDYSPFTFVAPFFRLLQRIVYCFVERILRVIILLW